MSKSALVQVMAELMMTQFTDEYVLPCLNHEANIAKLLSLEN